MVGILIIARLGSTRLSRKHLIEVEGMTFIEWLAARIQHEMSAEIVKGSAKLVICTADKEENRTFARLFEGSGVDVFYGSEENIPLRLFECAEALSLDYIVSVDGDDILCSTAGIRKVLEQLINEDVVYVKTSGLPLGMNTAGYSTAFLRDSVSRSGNRKLETGWGRIFDDLRLTLIQLGDWSGLKQLRFTLDYEEDAVFFKKIIESFKREIITVGDNALIDFVLEGKVYEINAGRSEEYFENFQRNVSNE